MSNLVLPTVGAIVGGLYGGQTGAALGWTLGSMLSGGNELPEMRQNTIGDLRVQTSQYGVNIPVAIGKQRITGNVIWSTEKQPYETRTVHGGKGGAPEQTVVTVGYKISMAIAICKGPILGISRVWQDGQLIIDSSVDSKPLIGTLYTGNNTQLPDSTMEGILGAGNVPAYRGLAYIVLTNFDLGQAGRVPIFGFEVVREGGI